MHRPAPRDLDFRLQPAIKQAPELLKPLEAVKRQLEAGDYAAAERRSTSSRRRCSARAEPTDLLTDARDALAPDAYWRQVVWKKVARHLRGAGREHPLHARPLHRPLHDRRRQGDVDGRGGAAQVAGGPHGPAGGRPDPHRSTALRCGARRHPDAISRLEGTPGRARRRPRREARDSRAGASDEDRRRLPARASPCKGEGLALFAAAKQSVRVDVVRLRATS